MVSAPMPPARPASAPAATPAQRGAAAEPPALGPAPVQQPQTQALAALPPEDNDRPAVFFPWFRPQSPPPPAEPAVPAAAPAEGVATAPAPEPRPASAPPVAPVAPVAPVSPVASATQGPQPTVTSRGTVSTMVIPGGVGEARVTVTPGEPVVRGPQLASLPNPSAQDWPRYLPGARGDDRNSGPAGEKVIPDPGVALSCLPAPVRRALNDVALRFGPVIVRSTMRGNGRFVRQDEWRGSYHRDCRAADFRVANAGGVMAFLRSRPDLGGVKRYRNGLIHIDDGPRRSW